MINQEVDQLLRPDAERERLFRLLESIEHGAAGSSFADWWAYKFEVYDAIPQNTSIMDERGVSVSVAAPMIASNFHPFDAIASSRRNRREPQCGTVESP